MKTANEILFEHGINTMSLNDDFNSQLLNAMERYAEEKISNSDGWASVRDGFPENGERVIAFADYGGYFVAYRNINDQWRISPEWRLNIPNGTLINITHWRLLPAPPNEKSASLKPNKITDSEIKKMAEKEFSLPESPLYDGDPDLEEMTWVVNEKRKSFIAGCKAIIALKVKQ